MAINETARGHYNNACIWLQQAVEAESVNEAIKLNGFAETAIKLAVFAVENHALVNGLDTDAPLSQMTQFNPAYSGPQPWGGLPNPGVPQQQPQQPTYPMAPLPRPSAVEEWTEDNGD